jgi:hypothetical protein
MIKKLALGAIAALLLPLVGCLPKYGVSGGPNFNLDSTEEPTPTEEPILEELPELEYTPTSEQIPERLEQRTNRLPGMYSNDNYDFMVREVIGQGGIAEYFYMFGVTATIEFYDKGQENLSELILDPSERRIKWIPSNSTEEAEPTKKERKQIYKTLKEMAEAYRNLEQNVGIHGVTHVYYNHNADQDNLREIILFSICMGIPLERRDTNTSEFWKVLREANELSRHYESEEISLGKGDILLYNKQGILFEDCSYEISRPGEEGEILCDPGPIE